MNLDDTFFFNLSDAGLSFVDCVFGDATFNEKDAAIAISICIIVAYRKKAVHANVEDKE